MDLTNTDIEIRERSALQRVDLTFRFLVMRGLGIVQYSLLGIVPALVFNALLVFVLDPFEGWTAINWYATWVLIWYLCWIESPIVLAPLTIYLGQVLFRQPVSWRYVGTELLRRQWRQVVVHGVIRTQGFWAGLILLAYMAQSVELFYFCVFFGVSANALFGLLRPYIEQIIYLEQLPFWKRDNYSATIGQRSALLHSFNLNHIFTESALVSFVVTFFFVLFYAILLNLYYWGTFNTVTQNWFAWSLFPLALWSTHVLATIQRFFGYLDTRIRSEGWELELRMKSAAEVLAGSERRHASVRSLA